MIRRRVVYWVCFLLLLGGCGGGAVVFAPTALPPDLSPLRYEHPSGAFSIVVPRTWPAYERNTPALALAAFSVPGEFEPLLTVAVMNLGEPPESSAFSDLINQYQQEVRPDQSRYTEQDRQAMGDGSWRLTGLRQTSGGLTQQVNTFIAQDGALISVIDAVVPADASRLNELQAAINTLTVNREAALQSGPLTVLSAAAPTALEVINVSTWTTPAGVFFITGEVTNLSSAPLSNVPVRAVLYTESGLGVAEAVDTIMGYTLPPGGFAPFSLRFGQGQPALTNRYEIFLGGEAWQPGEAIPVYGGGQLSWTNESTVTEQGQLFITGTVTNIGEQSAHHLRATVTVFDARRRVIAAGYTDITPEQLAPDQTIPYQIIVPEMGGEPANYIINIQGLAS